MESADGWDVKWQQAVTRTYDTYDPTGAGLQLEKLVKHAVKAAKNLGVPGQKGDRSRFFTQILLPGARCSCVVMWSAARPTENR